MVTNLRQKLIARAIHCAQRKETVAMPVGRQLTFEKAKLEWQRGGLTFLKTIETRKWVEITITTGNMILSGTKKITKVATE